jgi:hypothetical protein
MQVIFYFKINGTYYTQYFLEDNNISTYIDIVKYAVLYFVYIRRELKSESTEEVHKVHDLQKHIAELENR